MTITKTVYKSTKHIGEHEEAIIKTLTEYFKIQGYDVFPHSSLNIAWGSVISDVDLLLIKNQTLTYVEVKSSKDKISRAKQQIERVKDYVDYAYVATSKQKTNFEMPKVGLIKICKGEIKVSKIAEKFSNKPSFYSVSTLKKKCLIRFLGENKSYLTCTNKYKLAQNVYTKKEYLDMRQLLKEIVTCGDLCSSNCPLSEKGKSSPIFVN